MRVRVRVCVCVCARVCMCVYKQKQELTIASYFYSCKTFMLIVGFVSLSNNISTFVGYLTPKLSF